MCAPSLILVAARGLLRARHRELSTALFAMALLFGCAPRLHPQQAGDADLQITTHERLDTEPWWPTLSTVPLEAFAGSAACAHCHSAESAGQRSSAMGLAAAPAHDATFLRDRSALTLSSSPLQYHLAASAAGVEYTVGDGTHHLSRMLDWIMGAGVLGRTFLYKADDHWFQSEVSFYTGPSALDATTGLTRDAHPDLPAALGERLSEQDAVRCFSCHTVHATTSQGFNPLHAEAGLGCEACHGPAREHVTRMTGAAESSAGPHPAASARTDTAVFNPAKLSPADSIDFCGSCHRSFADVASMGQVASTAVVRFQPYRLEESRCWRETRDERLTCVACHDPHQPLQRDDASYDQHCQQCHSAVSSPTAVAHAGKVCPKATSRCVSCHMPKVNIASMHGDFTDHFIRVVKPGEAFPP